MDFFFFVTFLSYSQGSTCSNIEPFCSDTGVNFPNTTGVSSAETGPSYGCLGSTPNPAWFFIKIGSDGNLNLLIEQNTAIDFTGTGLDVDFISWGPFSQTEIEAGVCNNLTASNTVACSYSPAAIETFNIFGATTGDYYIVLITNFDGSPGFIKMDLLTTSSGSTDCSILDSTLGPDQNICESDSVTLDATPTTGTAVSYKWSIDTGAGFVGFTPAQTGATLTIDGSTGVAKVSGSYKVELVDINGTTETDVAIITFTTVPIANSTTDIILCDDNNDDLWSFDLTTRNTDILGTQDPTLFTITYYTSQADADTDTNPIATPTAYVNTSNPQTIFARITNNNNIDCYDTTSFVIQVFDSAFPSTTISVLGECDNNSVGTDTDGFIIFDLTDRATEILNGQSATDFTLTYFTDATYTVQIPVGDLTNFTNSIINGQTIYVRMTNNLNATCFADTSFDIVVYPYPVLVSSTGIPPYELVQCDDPSNDAEANFNLFQANVDVINPITTETFLYYTSEALAIAGVSGTEIANPTSYLVTGSVGQVWVRVVTPNGCFRTALVDLIIRPSQINPDYQLYQCDDFLDIDGNDNANNDDFDGVTYFDFQNEIDLILAPFSGTAGVSVSCHHTEADSDAGINPIDPATYSNYRNKTAANQEKIWVRIVSTLGNDCLANGNFITLNVNPTPTINSVADLELCDDISDGDDTNGIGVSFDLESQTNSILQSGMTTANFPVSYHLSKADADSGVNSISSPYTNITNGETIYIRVANANTGCIYPHDTFNLNVNSLPIIDFTNISLASECDNDDDGDDTNGSGVTFDLGGLRNDFKNLQPDIATVNYTVSYHENLADAEVSPGLNPLPDLYPNIVNNQTIFVRIENDNTGCVRIVESPTFLVVNPLPILVPITVNPSCDNLDDADDTNGSVTWNLEDLITNFESMQTIVDPVTVTFYSTLTAATSSTSAITTASVFANTTNPQEIFVRVTNDITGCFRVMHAFDLIVNPLPEFELADESLVCENILPHEISVENPAESDYIYEWFNSNGVSIGNDQTLIITDIGDITVAGVNYTVTATNPTTFCERTKSIRVWKSSIATITDADIVTVEFSSPENSIKVLTDNLGSGDYEFALEHPNDSRYYQDEPMFRDLIGGIYTLLVRDKNGCGEASIEVVLIDYPKFLTPNNDGYNDTWQLLGVESAKYIVSPIEIYDRYGKLITVIKATDIGWDGNYNGSALPSGGFWFALQLTDQLGNTKLHRGNFSLVRR